MPYKNTSLCATQKQSYSIKWPLFAKMSALISSVALFVSFAVMCVILFMQFELDRVLCLSIVTLAVAVVGIVFASFAMHADKKNNKKLKGAGATAIVAIILVLATSLAGATVGFLQVQTYGDGIYESISNGDGTCSLKLVNPAAQKLLYEKSGELEIPSNFNGEVVTSIQDLDFHNSIHKVTIPASVASIGESFSGNKNLTEIVFENNSNIGELCDNAFSDCVNLQKISFGEDSALSQIGNSAFHGCKSLTSITIPDNVTTIGANAFANCNGLAKVSFKNDSNLVIIGDRAFSGCSSLTNVILPEGVAEIGDFAFDSCDHLLSVGISSGLISVGDTIFSNCHMLDVINFDGNMELWSDVIKRADLGKSFDQYLITFTPEADELAYAFSSADDGYVVMGVGNYHGKDLIIPATFDELPIVRIYNRAFFNHSSVKSVTIEGENIHIEDGAFSGCDGLTAINGSVYATSTIAKQTNSTSYKVSVTHGNVIGNNAYKNCKGLVGITISDDVQSIGSSAFSGSGLENITISKNIVSIDDEAFANCEKIKAVIFQNNNLSIGSKVFSGCSSIENVIGNSHNTGIVLKQAEPTSVSVVINEGNNIERNIFNGCIGLINISFADSIVSVEDEAFKNCTGLNDITLPNSIISIGSNAFLGCKNLERITGSTNMVGTIMQQAGSSIKSIVLTSGSAIENGAFSGCDRLETVSIADSVTSIGENAFKNCVSLTEIAIPANVSTIGNSAFEGCSSLVKVTLPSEITEISESAFEGCSSLKTVALPEKVVNINDGAFSNCAALETVVLPNNIGTIGARAFSNCTNLGRISLPVGLENIGEYAFNNCKKISSIVIPDSVKTIAPHTFDNCSGMNSLSIGNTVVHISDYAFNGCSTLNGIVFPKSVKTIGKNVFDGCNQLTNVTGNIDIVCEIMKQIGSSIESIVITGGSAIENSTFSGYSKLESISIADSVTSIDENAFKNCVSLTEIAIPANVSTIGNSAFSGCSSLAKVTLPSEITSISESAFEGCSALKTVTLPDKVANINNKAFSNCASLKTVVLPNSVRTIGARAFSNCTNLGRISLPDGLEDIGEYAFNNCKKIRSISLPDSVKVINNNVFEDCSSLKTVTVGNDITRIGEFAFCRCTSLDGIIIPDGIEAIERGAFGTCESIKYFTIPSTVKSIGLDSFYGCINLETVSIHTTLTTIGQGAFYNCSKLATIEYSGLISQWNAIVKNQWWDFYTGEYVVRCTDGYTGYPGLGTAESPFNIYMPEDLKNVNQSLSAHYRLAKDIDLTGIEWDPIGYVNNEYQKFTGNFNGNGHTIKGLTRRTSPIMVGVDAYVGLFAIIENATVSGIKFENVDILFPNVSKDPSYVYVGTLAGRANMSTVEKISVSGKVQGGWDASCAKEEYIGGVLGSANETTIRYCSNKADVLGYHWLIWAGGILGFCQGPNIRIEYCYNTGYIEIGTGFQKRNWNSSAGGIIGCVNYDFTVYVSNCYSYCKIKNFGSDYKDIGGIVATATGSENSTTINRNYYCVQGQYSQNGGYFDDTIYEVKNAQKEGNRVTETQILSGNQIGTLFIYDANNIKLNPGYCWVYKNGEPPKLFWE